MSLDSDSLKCLDEVKKGKPRRFAMIVKGEKIVSLFVFKKGTIERYKKLAKEEGKGQFYHGVIDGKGQNIAFKLCRGDGFEEPPGKDAKLRMFLKEEAGMPFQPTYEIVDVLPAVSEVDEDDGSKESSTVAQAPASADSGLAVKLTQALGAMTPLIKQALAAHPERKAEILQPAADIKAAIGAGRLDEAKSQLLSYSGVVKALASGKAAAATPADVKTAASSGEANGISGWRSARQHAVDQLTALAKAIAATKDPDAKGALIELQSIAKNLTASPDTPEKVLELERYLRDDDVITAAEEAPPRFGSIKLREPLLKALAGLST